MKKIMVMFFAAVLFLGIGSGAQAVDSPFLIDNVPNVIGIGAGMYPDYVGSDDYTAGAAPMFRYTFAGSERYIQLFVTELSFNALNHPNFALGPVLNYRFGRSDDVDDKVVKRMEEIDGTVEAGVFFNYIWKEAGNPRHRFVASAELLADVGGEHDGWVALAGMRYWYPVNKPLDLLFGLGTVYGSSDYMDTYFGVSTVDSARTGLRYFEADSGFRDVNATFAAVFHFSEKWHLGAGVKYFGLMSDASDSPVVDDRGSSSQWVYGLGLAYSW